MKVLGSHHLLLIPQHNVTCYDLHRKPDVQGNAKRIKSMIKEEKKEEKKKEQARLAKERKRKLEKRKEKKKPNLPGWLKRRKK